MSVESQVDKKMKMQEKKEARFKRTYELLNEGFFINRMPIDIANEIEELVKKIQSDNGDSYGIIDYISQYRHDKRIDDNVVAYGVNNKVRNLMGRGILAKKSLEERLKSIATDIKDERERITIELFL